MENWPVSNYGVFINRHVPSDIREYRFACSCEGEEIYAWIPREQLPRSQTTLSRMIRLAHSYRSQSELDNIVQEVKNYQTLLNPACEELVLLRGWGETDDSGRLTARFEPVHYEVIRDRSITMMGG